MKLQAGVNVLSWLVYSLQTDTVSMTTAAAVKIRLIDIRGYLIQCKSLLSFQSVLVTDVPV